MAVVLLVDGALAHDIQIRACNRGGQVRCSHAAARACTHTHTHIALVGANATRQLRTKSAPAWLAVLGFLLLLACRCCVGGDLDFGWTRIHN